MNSEVMRKRLTNKMQVSMAMVPSVRFAIASVRTRVVLFRCYGESGVLDVYRLLQKPTKMNWPIEVVEVGTSLYYKLRLPSDVDRLRRGANLFRRRVLAYVKTLPRKSEGRRSIESAWEPSW